MVMVCYAHVLLLRNFLDIQFFMDGRIKSGWKDRQSIDFNRGAGRYEKLVVLLLTIVLYVLDCQKIGGAIKGTSILSWQKLVVL